MSTLIKMVDFGIFIMIWLVQLVVYPAFQYFTHQELLQWHNQYTRGITVIVMPLMLGQLFLHGYQVFQLQTPTSVITLALVLAAWYITFIHAVPLHNKISMSSEIDSSIKSLLRFNLGRALLWTAVLAMSILIRTKAG